MLIALNIPWDSTIQECATGAIHDVAENTSPSLRHSIQFVERRGVTVPLIHSTSPGRIWKCLNVILILLCFLWAYVTLKKTRSSEVNAINLSVKSPFTPSKTTTRPSVILFPRDFESFLIVVHSKSSVFIRIWDERNLYGVGFITVWQRQRAKPPGNPVLEKKKKKQMVR